MKNVKARQKLSLASLATVSTAVLATLLLSGSLTSCTKDGLELNPSIADSIAPTANVQATTHTKASVDGTTFPANTDDVFRLMAFSGSAAPTTDWSAAPYFNNIQVNSGAASALTLSPAQYYPANGDNLYFYGYAPQATSLTAGTASAAPIANYTITGQQDIMTARVTTGIAKAVTGVQGQPEFAFTHKLMQLRFKVVADASYETEKKVSKISVKRVRTSAKLDIATGVLTFDGTADQTLSLPIVTGTNDGITATGTEMDSCIMLESTGAGSTIVLDVTAGDATYNDIEVSLTGTDNGTAGTSHLITLTFKLGEITPSATITPWRGTGSGSADVGVLKTPKVGDYYYSDGSFSTVLKEEKTATGMIYYIYPADPHKYKVMSLEEAPEIKWAAAETYVVSGARSDVDGKANSAAIKAAFDAKVAAGVAIAQQNFEDVFPAAAYCYNYRGMGGTDAVGTWHLPAKSELQYLWCSYNGVAPRGWADYEPNSDDVPMNTTVQTTWNTRIMVGGAKAGITSGALWSSTESSANTSNAWYVHFSTGYTYNFSKTGTDRVRCVRDL